MRPISVAMMIAIDRLVVEEYGIVLLQMMENAGRVLLGGPAARRRVVALIGKGNNGGGGPVAARRLAMPPGDLGAVPEHQRQALARMACPGAPAPPPRIRSRTCSPGRT